MRTKRRRVHTKWQHGFSLVEVLAALAIASVIIVAAGVLVHNVALSFDRGTRGVSEGERLILAIERLAADIGSTRFVQRKGEGSTALAFIGESARIVFVGIGGVTRNHGEEEVVNLSVEQEGDVTRLVRRRAPWFGPRTRFEELELGDPVILLEGKYLISFAFGRVTQNSALAWSDAWKGQVTLPRFVRMIIRDPVTGSDLLGETEFVIRAETSIGCARSGSPACFASTGESTTRTNP
jgi:prepilin-type N-terminal cleavage/methylation domain-containing protein